MTNLKCSATTCYYNQDRLCARGSIDVTGEEAKHSEETSCASFKERGSDGLSNSCAKCGCNEIQIDCSAHHCTYNEDCRCTASSITVDGPDAHSVKETKCDTFRCK